MKERDLKIRTKKFAHDCVKLASLLPESKLGLHLQGQLIRYSTSVASNYRTSFIAQSKRAFIAKISKVIEEIDESNFWVTFINDEKILKNKENELNYLLNESAKLTAIFISSRKTAQLNLLGEDSESYLTKQNSYELLSNH